MLVLNSPQVVQETSLRWKREHRVAVVTTMGAIHEGHRKLIRLARQYGGKVIVTVFVNPLQFGPNEDFAKYPRPFEEDQAAIEEEGADLLFHPSVKDLYPDGFVSRVVVKALSEPLEGAFRPGHFEGVATVCLKLFQITQGDFAIFGEKDFQQLRLLQQMIADFNLPLTIIPHVTVRESDGLALSSRNRFLTPEERQRAKKLPEALFRAQTASLVPGATVGTLCDDVRRALEGVGFVVDYVAIAPSETLVPAPAATTIAPMAAPRLLVAAKMGTTRLIDNVPLGCIVPPSTGMTAEPPPAGDPGGAG